MSCNLIVFSCFFFLYILERLIIIKIFFWGKLLSIFLHLTLLVCRSECELEEGGEWERKFMIWSFFCGWQIPKEYFTYIIIYWLVNCYITTTKIAKVCNSMLNTASYMIWMKLTASSIMCIMNRKENLCFWLELFTLKTNTIS